MHRVPCGHVQPIDLLASPQVKPISALSAMRPDVLQEMASRHRVRYSSLSIIKTATVPPALCKRDGTKQFHNSKIAFPVTQKLARCGPPAPSAALVTLLILCSLTCCTVATTKHSPSPRFTCSACSFGRHCCAIATEVVRGPAASGRHPVLLLVQAIFAGVQDRVQGGQAISCCVLSLLTGLVPDWEDKLCK